MAMLCGTWMFSVVINICLLSKMVAVWRSPVYPQPLQHLVLLDILNLEQWYRDEIGPWCVFVMHFLDPWRGQTSPQPSRTFWPPMCHHLHSFLIFFWGWLPFSYWNFFLKDFTTASEGYTILYSMNSQQGQKSVLGEWKKSYSFHVENIAMHIPYKQIFGISVVLKFHKRWLGKKCLKQPGRNNEKKAEKHWFIAIFPSLWQWTSLGAYLFPSSGQTPRNWTIKSELVLGLYHACQTAFPVHIYFYLQVIYENACFTTSSPALGFINSEISTDLDECQSMVSSYSYTFFGLCKAGHFKYVC